MSELTQDPREVDRIAVQTEFFRNIKRHAWEDAKGEAPRPVSVKLRDKLNLKHWGVALNALIQETTNPEMLRLLKVRQLECSDLRMAEGRIDRMMKQRAQQDRGVEGMQFFQKKLAEYGWEFPDGISTKEITCILLAAIEANLREAP